jgi:hypothetical protein
MAVFMSKRRALLKLSPFASEYAINVLQKNSKNNPTKNIFLIYFIAYKLYVGKGI